MKPDHFELIDAHMRLLRLIPIPESKTKGMARMAFESECRARFGVDDVTLFLRDGALDRMP